MAALSLEALDVQLRFPFLTGTLACAAFACAAMATVRPGGAAEPRRTTARTPLASGAQSLPSPADAAEASVPPSTKPDKPARAPFSTDHVFEVFRKAVLAPWERSTPTYVCALSRLGPRGADLLALLLIDADEPEKARWAGIVLAAHPSPDSVASLERMAYGRGSQRSRLVALSTLLQMLAPSEPSRPASTEADQAVTGARNFLVRDGLAIVAEVETRTRIPALIEEASRLRIDIEKLR